MKNNRITAKERNLIMGSIRRCFSRSELRDEAIKKIIVDHVDPKRKRVKTWCKCPICGKLDAKSNFHVDHVIPIIEIEKSLVDYTWDQVVDRIWCEPDNLMAICKAPCHKTKTKKENKLRRKYKKENKK